MAGRHPGGRYFAEFDDEAPVPVRAAIVFRTVSARWRTMGTLCEQYSTNYVGNRGSRWWMYGHGNTLDLVRTLALCAYQLGAGRSAQSAAVEHERHVSEDVVRRR